MSGLYPLESRRSLAQFIREECGCRRFFLWAVGVTLVTVSIVLLAIQPLFCVVLYNQSSDAQTDAQFKYDFSTMNIIFMISDGFDPSSETFARTWKGKDSGLLPLDDLLVGSSRTYSEDSPVTDSAAGATAYTCGSKTYNGAIGVVQNPEGTPLDGIHPAIPCGTIFEAAQSLNFSTGLVVTSRITHATPASFYAHMSHRDYEQLIAEQLVGRTFPVDVIFGGGRNQFIHRTIDDRNLVTELENQGYSYIDLGSQLDSVNATPVIGLFADSHMDYKIDRDTSNLDQPTLPQMVEKALSLLVKSKKQFFLMIEGSRIDMAAHAHDATAHYEEISAYQETVSLIRKFILDNPNTLVISTSDHGTGGISTGAVHRVDNDPAHNLYPIYTWYPSAFQNQSHSTEWMASEIIGLSGGSKANVTTDVIKKVMEQDGISDMKDYELEYIQNGFQDPSISPAVFIGDMISSRGLIGWTTPGHVGTDVNLYAAGYIPKDLHGVLLNTRVGNIVADVFKFHSAMSAITSQLADMELPLSAPVGLQKKAYYGHD